MIDLTHLTPDSTLSHLPWHQFEVGTTTQGHVVAAKFEQFPELPGVIITEHSRLVGMISRRKFYESITLHHHIEIYRDRPIYGLLNLIRVPPLIFSQNCLIHEAATIAISRSKVLLDEPVVIVFANQTLGLIDVQTLLLAQSILFKWVNQTLQVRTEELNNLQAELKVEQLKELNFHQILNRQKNQLLWHTQLVEQQKNELFQKSQKINHLNEHLLKISQLLSIEAKNAFQATLVGVDSIFRNTDEVLEIGKTITQELERIDTTSRLMGEIIQNVRQIAVDSIVETNHRDPAIHSPNSMQLERIKLVSQTFEVGTQINQIAIRLRMRVQELTKSARGGASLARSLIYKLECAQTALSELETLVQSQNFLEPNLSVSTTQAEIQDVAGGDFFEDNFAAVEPTALRAKIEQAEMALIELEELVKNQDLKLLIQKIEETLRRHHQKIV